jgi:sugar transferase EpsL
MLKRLFDIVMSLLFLVFLSPLIILVFFSIRICLGAPVFFCQPRSGLNGVPFLIYKFRTMSIKKDLAGNLLSDEERLTTLGRFLRKTSIDEIPQLLNVFKGDMSLVGPRPLLVEYKTLYSPEQDQRHNVRPGITGWAQVHGRNSISWQEKFLLDIWYVENLSFSLDMKILYITMLKVFNREGVNASDAISMKKFTGNP